jgi:flavin-dependent dehydrogenase
LEDVLIVGAGPAGNQVAYRLASLGYTVTVLEEHERIGDPVNCTGIVGAECLDRFSVGNGTILGKANSARFYFPSGDFLRLEKETVQAYILDRAALDLDLAQKAQEQGAQYLLGSRVETIRASEQGVKAVVNGERELEAKTLVIASGFGSKLPERLGLGRIEDYVAGVQTEVIVDGTLPEVEVCFGRRVAPGFFAWLVPTSEGKALAGLFSRRKQAL